MTKTIDALERWGATQVDNSWVIHDGTGYPERRWTPAPDGGWFYEVMKHGKWTGRTWRMTRSNLPLEINETMWGQRFELAKQQAELATKLKFDPWTDPLVTLEKAVDAATDTARPALLDLQYRLVGLGLLLVWPDEFVRKLYEDGYKDRKERRDAREKKRDARMGKRSGIFRRR